MKYGVIWIFFCLAACQTQVSFIHTGEQYPSYPVDKKINIILHDPPEKENYIEVGLIVVYEDHLPDSVAAAAQKAREVGADTIIALQEIDRELSYTSWKTKHGYISSPDGRSYNYTETIPETAKTSYKERRYLAVRMRNNEFNKKSEKNEH